MIIMREDQASSPSSPHERGERGEWGFRPRLRLLSATSDVIWEQEQIKKVKVWLFLKIYLLDTTIVKLAIYRVYMKIIKVFINNCFFLQFFQFFKLNRNLLSCDVTFVFEVKEPCGLVATWFHSDVITKQFSLKYNLCLCEPSLLNK